jgi:hypothetical protein
MEVEVFILIVVIVVVVFAFLSLSKRMTVIKNPRFAMLNLQGEAAVALIAEDKAALAPIFGEPQVSKGVVPHCDVLFIYCEVSMEGVFVNAQQGLRDIIRDAGAKVVVIASENEGDAYIAWGKTDRGTTHGKANLVMTMTRNGTVFPSFFARLFTLMKQGRSMPMAWVKLAPQIPGHEHSDCPGAIFSCEAGQVRFR